MKPENKRIRLTHPDGSATSFGPAPSNEMSQEHPEDTTEVTENEVLRLIETFPLPLRPNSMSIVGFGAHSVAVRIGFKQAGVPDVVGVLRYFDTSNELPNLPGNDSIRDAFQDYCLPEWVSIVSDTAGRRLSLKLAPEVIGSTLKDVSPLHTLSNPEVLKQLANFCDTTVKFFIREKKMPDLVGHTVRGKSFSPFYSSNLMITHGSNELRLVDTDLMPTNDTATATSKRSLTLFAKMATIFLHGVFAHTLSSLLPKPERHESMAGAEERTAAAGLSALTEILADAGADYRILGSIAVASYLEKNGKPYSLDKNRADGTKRDIDVLVLNKDPAIATAVEAAYADLLAKQNDFPDLSVTSTAMMSSQNHTNLHKVLPRFTTTIHFSEDGSLVQSYGSLSMALPDSDMTPVIQEFHGVSFKTLSPEILLGLALTRNGIIRFKDLDKYQRFSAENGFTPPPSYVDFARQIRTRHKEYYRNFLVRQWLSILTKGALDGVLTKRLR